MARPFPLSAHLPEVLRGVILDLHWDIEKLHGLADLPEVVVPVADLSWHLELPFWAFDGAWFQVSPNQVAADPERYHAQWARTLAADLTFPVHVRADQRGRFVILDGVHRLLKATILGREFMAARIVEPQDLAAIAL